MIILYCIFQHVCIVWNALNCPFAYLWSNYIHISLLRQNKKCWISIKDSRWMLRCRMTHKKYEWVRMDNIFFSVSGNIRCQEIHFVSFCNEQPREAKYIKTIFGTERWYNNNIHVFGGEKNENLSTHKSWGCLLSWWLLPSKSATDLRSDWDYFLPLYYSKKMKRKVLVPAPIKAMGNF